MKKHKTIKLTELELDYLLDVINNKIYHDILDCWINDVKEHQALKRILNKLRNILVIKVYLFIVRLFLFNQYVCTLFFEYIKKSERNNPYENGNGKITNVGNVPFENPNYNKINSLGRQWIFEYALAVTKEILGYVRGKYSTIPIPGADMTLNQDALITAATSEKERLIEKLRAHLETTSREKLLEKKANEAEHQNKTMGQAPMNIFIG